MKIKTLFFEDLEKEIFVFKKKTSRINIKNTDVAEIVYTSGTTGNPKGVILTHQNIVSDLLMIEKEYQVKKECCFLSLLPLSHLFEETLGLFLPLHNRASIVYLSFLKIKLIREACKTEPVTHMILVPRILDAFRNGILEKIRQYHKEEKFRGMLSFASSLPFSFRKILFKKIHNQFGKRFKFFIIGGAPFEEEAERFWNQLGFRVMQGYGLTETSPVLTCNMPHAHKQCSVGKVLDGILLDFKEGEILAKGPNVFVGYYHDAEKTKKVLNKGWFSTGDMGKLDEEGFLFLKGRKKDMIVLPDGMNVYPEDIECVLNKQRGIKACCVLFVKNKIHAVLIMEKEKEDIKKIIEKTNAQLQEHQHIQDYSLWPEEDFPRTPTLKIRKFKVQEYVEKNKLKEKIIKKEEDHLVLLLAEICHISLAKIKSTSTLTKDLGLSSLDRVELLSRIEDVFSVEIDEASITPKTTVHDLRDLVKKGTQEQRMRFRMGVYNLPCKAFRYFFQVFFFFPFFRIFMKVKKEGLEHLQEIKKPVIFVSNHESYLDAIAILKAMPLRIKINMGIAAWKEFFDYKKRKISHNILKWFLYQITTIFFGIYLFAQQTGIKQSLINTGRVMDLGNHVLLFPEGRRSVDRNMLPFKNGIGMLVQKMKVAIVPVKIKGMYALYNIHDTFPKQLNYPVTITFGKPILFDKEESVPTITKKIEQKMKEL